MPDDERGGGGAHTVPPGAEGWLGGEGTGVLVTAGPGGVRPHYRHLGEAGQGVVTVAGGQSYRAVRPSNSTSTSSMLLQVLRVVRTELERGPQTDPGPQAGQHFSLPDSLDVDHGHHHGQQDQRGGHRAQRHQEGRRHRGQQDGLGRV